MGRACRTFIQALLAFLAASSGVIAGKVAEGVSHVISMEAAECDSDQTARDNLSPCNSLHLLQQKQQRMQPENTTSRLRKLMKGVSYSPSPLATVGRTDYEDFFCTAAKPMWGDEGRGDLRIIKTLGANTVRLYGNDPHLPHNDFLDQALSLGLDVIPGVGDLAYQYENCKVHFSCADGVKQAYRLNLEKGFLHPDGAYHPAIKHLVVINEPDLKMPGVDRPRSFAKAIATAIDGALEAEREAGIKGAKPNLTITFSFAKCPWCPKHGQIPGLGQMWMMRDALQNPSSYGFNPKNNLTDLFRTRFTYSFNTGNPSTEINWFLKNYEQEFPTTPVFIAEYHNPGNNNTQKDLQAVISISNASALLLGISFFEFQNRYDKGGHLIWGIFDPQTIKTDGTPFAARFTSQKIEVPCLSPVFDKALFKSIPEQITIAYGGQGADAAKMCAPDPEQVPVSAHGFYQILGLQNTSAMQVFIKRVVKYMGGWVPGDVPETFADLVSSPRATFRHFESLLVGHPDWALWDFQAACVVNRHSLASVLAGKIGYTCGLGYADCTQVPEECKDNVWDTASWVFSSHFKELTYSKDARLSPLEDCYFDGVAHFVGQSVWGTSTAQKQTCVVPLGKPDPSRVIVSSFGFYQIWLTQDADRMKTFIKRSVRHMGGQTLADIPAPFIKEMLDANSSLSELSAALAKHPSWARWSTKAACVPARQARAADVGATIGTVCSKNVLDCDLIPPSCKGNVWDTAAFVFGSYFEKLSESGHKVDPLYDCSFKGVGMFSSPDVYETHGINRACIVPVTA